MDDYTNAIASVGVTNAYGELMKQMNEEFIKELEQTKTRMKDHQSVDDIANSFHNIFVSYLLKSAYIQSQVKK